MMITYLLTLLEKMATIAQINDLFGMDIERLANRYGHSAKIHQEYYRLHDNAMELLRFSRPLLEFDRAKGKLFKRKRFSEIEVDSKFLYYFIFFFLSTSTNALIHRGYKKDLSYCPI